MKLKAQSFSTAASMQLCPNYVPTLSDLLLS